MIRSLTSVRQFRRRSTVEMISAAMCLTWSAAWKIDPVAGVDGVEH
jgi:hypothetical protein